MQALKTLGGGDSFIKTPSGEKRTEKKPASTAPAGQVNREASRLGDVGIKKPRLTPGGMSIRLAPNVLYIEHRSDFFKC